MESESEIQVDPVEPFEATLPVVTQTTITAYQYGDRGQYIGPYTFEKNLDTSDDYIHLPPKTTMTKPMDVTEEKKNAFWNGASWEIKDADFSWKA